MDEKELDRQDLQHHKYTLLLNDRLHVTPIPGERLQEAGSRVLGTYAQGKQDLDLQGIAYAP